MAKEVAPFDVILIDLLSSEHEINSFCSKLYNDLIMNKIDVLQMTELSVQVLNFQMLI